MTISNEKIRFRINGGEAQEIPASQEALLLRFLWQNRGRKVVWDDMYQALGKSPEVNRCIHRLRREWLIPIPCDMVPKRAGKGKYGLYYLDPAVEVIGEGRSDAC